MMSEHSANKQVNILLNGEPKMIPADITAAHLIEMLELGGKRLAVEINEEIIPRSRYAAHLIQARDRVEIVQAIGGG